MIGGDNRKASLFLLYCLRINNFRYKYITSYTFCSKSLSSQLGINEYPDVALHSEVLQACDH